MKNHLPCIVVLMLGATTPSIAETPRTVPTSAPQTAAHDMGPAEIESLKPLMVVADRAVLQNDFSETRPLDTSVSRIHQQTQWAIENGVLHGRPASPDFQASRPDHNGLEARISFPNIPAEFAARFSFRFSGGEWIYEYKPGRGLAPMLEFGHHLCRIAQQPKGIQIRVENEAFIVAENSGFSLEPGRWYHVLAESKGDEFVLQFAHGPTLYAKHETFAKAPPAHARGLWIGGPRLGEVEIDNLTVWSIQPDPNPTWTRTKAALPPPQTISRKERTPNQRR